MTSQINPNNIDGEYPVAGVSNNTQGMRDNFTNIKTNFQYAEDEIDDLQSKGVFKAALTGTTLDNNMANNVIYNAQVRGISGTVVAIAATSGTVNIDCNAGPYQTISITGNIILAFTAATWPPAGTFGMIRLRVNVDAAGRTMTLPVSVSQGTTAIQGLASSVLTFATAGIFEFGFSTIDAGTTITMYDFTRPLDYYTDTVIIANTAVSTNAGSGALIVAGGVGVSGNLYVTGDIVGNIVVTGSTFTGNVTGGNLLTGGLVSATGNITGGNLRTGGLVSATGNVTGGNLLSATLSLSGNVLSAINTTANITTTANISVGNVLINGITTGTGNVTGGNLRTTGQMSASGNVTGGNILSSAVVSAVGNATILSATAVPAGGTTGAGYKMSSTTNLGIFFGSGAPTLSAAQGSLYLRTDGTTTNDRMYVNTNGTTTWTAVITAA
jgi:hypothetical protein